MFVYVLIAWYPSMNTQIVTFKKYYFVFLCNCTSILVNFIIQPWLQGLCMFIIHACSLLQVFTTNLFLYPNGPNPRCPFQVPVPGVPKWLWRLRNSTVECWSKQTAKAIVGCRPSNHSSHSIWISICISTMETDSDLHSLILIYFI